MSLNKYHEEELCTYIGDPVFCITRDHTGAYALRKGGYAGEEISSAYSTKRKKVRPYSALPLIEYIESSRQKRRL